MSSTATPDLRSKHWCFTHNNYTQETIDRLSSLTNTTVTYLIFGKEIGETGTPHLQGFVSFPSRKRLAQVIQVLGQCHCSMARLISKSIEYCKKDGDFYEIGTPPVTQGQRNDLDAFKDDVKNGITNIKDLREKHSLIFAKYQRFCVDYLRDNKPKFEVDPFPLREWQQNLNSILMLPPDPRKIIFIVDVIGNTGKTWFFHYYNQLHENSQIIIPGKKLDMAYILDENCKTFMFDCPRSKQGEYIQYDFLEEVKNGYVHSGKYESINKRFKTPHVVVAMNEHPDLTKLSEDRYQIITLS